MFLKHVSLCPCYAMSSNGFPRGRILSPSLLSLFLSSFVGGVDRSEESSPEQPHPHGKKMLRSLWGWEREARLNISTPGLPLGKGSPGSDRAGAVCDVTHPHTTNKQASLLLSSRFSVEGQFLPAASSPSCTDFSSALKSRFNL